MGDMASEEVQWLSEAEQVSWRAYLRANRELDVALDRDLQAAGISLSEYELLSMLSEAPMGQLRMSALASLIVQSRSRVTHTISRLEKAGLVVRESCLSDGRGVEAILTEQGVAALHEAAPTHVAGVRAFLVDLAAEEDFAALGRVFDTVTDKLIEGNPAVDIR